MWWMVFSTPLTSPNNPFASFLRRSRRSRRRRLSPSPAPISPSPVEIPPPLLLSPPPVDPQPSPLDPPLTVSSPQPIASSPPPVPPPTSPPTAPPSNSPPHPPWRIATGFTTACFATPSICSTVTGANISLITCFTTAYFTIVNISSQAERATTGLTTSVTCTTFSATAPGTVSSLSCPNRIHTTSTRITTSCSVCIPTTAITGGCPRTLAVTAVPSPLVAISSSFSRVPNDRPNIFDPSPSLFLISRDSTDADLISPAHNHYTGTTTHSNFNFTSDADFISLTLNHHTGTTTCSHFNFALGASPSFLSSPPSQPLVPIQELPPPLCSLFTT